MEPLLTGTRCLACGAHYPVEEDRFTCPRCGANTEVTYDFEAVRRVLDRERLAAEPERSILRYRALLPVTDPAHYPALPVGGTPLLAPARLREAAGLPGLYLKDDSHLPSSSFKDRASAVALAHARSRGAPFVVAASTGNAGASLACLSASVGQPCAVFVPASAPRGKIAQLLLYGARVIAVRGSYDDAFDLSLAATARWGWYNRNTGTNPYTREGKKTVAFEIAEQLGWRVPDWVLVPVGDGNILAGAWKGFRDLRDAGLTDRLPRLVAVQSEQSDAVTRTLERYSGQEVPPSEIELVQVHATTLADSISVDLPRDGLAAVRAVRETRGVAVRVTDDAILDAMGELARLAGVFAEPAGAAAWAGARVLAEQGAIAPEDTVVVLVTGNGLKDVNSALRAAPEVVEVDPELDAVERVLGVG